MNLKFGRARRAEGILLKPFPPIAQTKFGSLIFPNVANLWLKLPPLLTSRLRYSTRWRSSGRLPCVALRVERVLPKPQATPTAECVQGTEGTIPKSPAHRPSQRLAPCGCCPRTGSARPSTSRSGPTRASSRTLSSERLRRTSRPTPRASSPSRTSTTRRSASPTPT